MGVLSVAQRAFLTAVAPRVVPGAESLDKAGAGRVLDLIDAALAERSRPIQRQFSLLLTVLRWSPALRYGRPLERLAPGVQDAVLRRFQDAPIQKVRSGFWSFRTLIFLGYYGRPEAADAISYRPSRDGNAILHDRTRR